MWHSRSDQTGMKLYTQQRNMTVFRLHIYLKFPSAHHAHSFTLSLPSPTPSPSYLPSPLLPNPPPLPTLLPLPTPSKANNICQFFLPRSPWPIGPSILWTHIKSRSHFIFMCSNTPWKSFNIIFQQNIQHQLSKNQSSSMFLLHWSSVISRTLLK